MRATRIVIIGGVAGGASTAARARRLNEAAEIVMLERGPHISFANCGLPYHIGGEIEDRDALFVQTPEAMRARFNIDVRVRSEVINIDRDAREVTVRDLNTGREYRESYDKLVIATGASPIRPPLPGVEHPRIFSLRDVSDMDAIKAQVDSGAGSAIVVGGGFIGLEMAENLHARGLNVQLVEMLDQVMPPLDREMAEAIHDELRQHGVALHLSDAVASFDDRDHRIAARLKSQKTLEADFVVLAIGVRPESKLASVAGLELGDRGGIRVNTHMQTSDPDVYAVGDAVIVKDFVTGADALIPLAGPANRQGRMAADHIFGRDSKYRGTQGTSIVRVFDLAVGMTGASEKSLQRMNVPYEKVFLHPGHHAGYFPGADPMHIKLLFEPITGRVFGAQITGGDGVDKRIDVMAMAVQAGMTVFDLEEAELAYAPQFGSAKDPVNMAGFAAANVVRGDTKIVHADRLDGALIIDVRRADERAKGSIPESIHIPLNELRARHGEIPNTKPIVLACAAGVRGYVGERMLAQLGYDVRNLSGGYETYRRFHPAGEAETMELQLTT